MPIFPRVLFATLSLFGATTVAVAAPPRGRPSTARQTSAPTIDIRGRDLNEQLRAAPVRRDPEMQALVLAALRRHADRARPTTPLDKAVARALGRVDRSGTIAKRIVARVDALPVAKRKKLLGTASAPSTDPTTIASTAADASTIYAGVGITPPETLPAEDLVPPSSYQLKVSGVEAVALDDDDGADELVVMVTRISASGSVETTSLPSTGSLDDLAAGEMAARNDTLHDGASSSLLLATAAFEVDGDGTAQREEYLAMVALAKALGDQLVQSGDTVEQKLARYAFALDYSIGLLAVSAPQTWPVGTLQKTALVEATSFHSLWSTPPSTEDGVKWRLKHDHVLPKGRYKVYFNVPSPIADRPNVKVKITRVESLDAEADGDDLTIEAEIKGASKERKLKYNKNAHNVTWSVQRLVAPDEPVQIGFELREFDVGPESGVVTSGWGASPCGYHTDPPYGPWQYPPCPDVNTKLGLGGGKLTVDLATGKISGAAAGQVGQTLTLSGASSPRGKIKVVVTVD